MDLRVKKHRENCTEGPRPGPSRKKRRGDCTEGPQPGPSRKKRRGDCTEGPQHGPSRKPSLQDDKLALIGKLLILSKMLKILVPFCDEDFQESIDYQLVDDHPRGDARSSRA
jgi:hypothetical protein